MFRMTASQLPDSESTRWHHLEMSEVVRLLSSHCETGLSQDEAARRLHQYGPNRVTAKSGTPAWKRFMLQFHQPLVYILLAASITTALLQEWVDL